MLILLVLVHFKNIIQLTAAAWHGQKQIEMILYPLYLQHR